MYLSLIFSNLVAFKTLNTNQCIYDLHTKVVKILEICKHFSENLINELVKSFVREINSTEWSEISDFMFNFAMCQMLLI